MSIPPSMSPQKKGRDALTSHGLDLLWGNASQGIQGMTKLTENMRFQGDLRFQAALKECRYGKVRNETYEWLLQFVLCSPNDPCLMATVFYLIFDACSCVRYMGGVDPPKYLTDVCP